HWPSTRGLRQHQRRPGGRCSERLARSGRGAGRDALRLPLTRPGFVRTARVRRASPRALRSSRSSGSGDRCGAPAAGAGSGPTPGVWLRSGSGSGIRPRFGFESWAVPQLPGVIQRGDLRAGYTHGNAELLAHTETPSPARSMGRGSRAITSTRAPGSTRSLRTGVLAGVRPTRTAIEVQLDQFQYPSAKSFTPKYRLGLLGYNNSDARELLTDPRCAIFPIAEAADKLGNSTLAIDVGSGGDPRIFEYRELTLFDDR